MHIRGIDRDNLGRDVSFQAVRDIVKRVSAENYDGNLILHSDARPIGRQGNPDYGFQGRLVVKSSRGTGARRSWTGRRMPAACWHTWRDVLREVFERYPDAVANTSMARYEGLAGFERTYPQTANQNIGSMMQPAYMSELCDCDDPE